eukprot:284733-Amorphochlora_amoeboformis.AAC.1
MGYTAGQRRRTFREVQGQRCVRLITRWFSGTVDNDLHCSLRIFLIFLRNPWIPTVPGKLGILLFFLRNPWIPTVPGILGFRTLISP